MKISSQFLQIAMLIFLPQSCSTIQTPKTPPTITAAIDCALPSLWNVVAPSAVEADVVSAITQKDPLAAIALVAESVGEAEVTCIVAKRDAIVQAEIKPNSVVSVTRQWLDQEKAKGLQVTNFQKIPPG
jgi:hypothetical protein